MTGLELDPCPFCYPHPACDEYPPVVKKEADNTRYWSVWAPCCDFYGPMHATPEEAARAWNKRGFPAELTSYEVVQEMERVLHIESQPFQAYTASRSQLIEFAERLAPLHARDAIADMTRRLDLERRRAGAKEQEQVSSETLSETLQELVREIQAEGYWKKSLLALVNLQGKDLLRDHLAEEMVVLTMLQDELGGLDTGDMPGWQAESIRKAESKLKEFMAKAELMIQLFGPETAPD